MPFVAPAQPYLYYTLIHLFPACSLSAYKITTIIIDGNNGNHYGHDGPTTRFGLVRLTQPARLTSSFVNHLASRTTADSERVLFD